jgi:hypothetical protein
MNTMKPVLATHQHCRCYYRLRKVVRIIFWSTVVVGLWCASSWLTSHGIIHWDEYQDTKDSLFPRR